MNSFKAVILLPFLLVGCSEAKLAISAADPAGVINSYEPITPILAGKATATMVASINKANQIADDTARAVIKELCLMEPDYKEYWIKRQWKKNGIDYRRACDSVNGDITTPIGE